MATITAAQLAHLKENQALFDQHQAEKDADIQDYFDEQEDEDGPGSVYLYICSDLGLTPVPAAETFTPRGFGDYATIENDLYGSKVVVRQSSLATESAVWIFAQETDQTRAADYTNPSPHLNPEMAKKVAAALLAWAADAESGVV